MKIARKSLALLMALVTLLGTFAVSASAATSAYVHPAGRFLLTPAPSYEAAQHNALIAPGETVYSTLAKDNTGYYMFNSGAANYLRFQFKASVPCDVEIVEAGATAIGSYSAQTECDVNITDIAPGKYYYIVVAPSADCQYTFTTLTNAITNPTNNKIIEPTLAISHKAATLYSTESLQLTITNDNPDIINFYWDVLDNEDTPLIDERDIVKVYGGGQSAYVSVERNSAIFNQGSVTANVRAYFYYNNNEYYKTCVITAKPANLEINPYFDSTDKNCVKLGVNGEQKIKASTSVKGARIIWSTKDASIAKVAMFGDTVRIIGVADGSTEVYADVCIKDANGEFTDILGRRTIRVDVSSRYSVVSGVTFEEANVTVRTGKTTTLKYKVLSSPADIKPENTNVTFTSSNPAVATVSEAGVVTAVSVGTTTITVKTEDGGFTAKCTVTVKEPLPDWLTILIAPLQLLYTLIKELFG